MFFGQIIPKETSEKADFINPGIKGTKAKVQKSQVKVVNSAGKTYSVFVDTIARVKSQTVIIGWSTSQKIEIFLLQGTRRWLTDVTRYPRGDVADALGLSSGDGLGFSIICEAPVADDEVELEINLPRCEPYRTGSLAEKSELSDLDRSLLPGLLEGALKSLFLEEIGSDGWWTKIEDLPEARKLPIGYNGFVEGIFISSEGDGIVFGWALHPAHAMIWLEDDAQNTYPLSGAFRRERRDIAQAFKEILWSDMEAAFIAHIPDLEANPTIRLRVATEAGIATLSERAGAELLPPEPRHAAEKLFAIETEDRIFHRRAPIIDWPVLKPLIERREAETGKLTPRIKDFGHLPDIPEVSIIVPLYRRFDFMEHQMLEFDRDPFIRSNAELIYVIDDPDIRQDVLNEADRLFRQFGFPFRVVSGMRNRGYSGANNLGAEHANGAHLLFLNSDVFPIETGWLEHMLAVFADDTVGAVGARLLFPDGGLQHAGMSFEYQEQFGIWTNQHKGMGLAQELDGAMLRDVPAVTGACVMLPRAVFDAIGGWDTGYLLGDFEDSDLCFAVRQAGYRILYEPSAVLTHLERQSFTGVGGDAFRIRMTICNAVRHQSRWADSLRSSAESPTDNTNLVQEGTE